VGGKFRRPTVGSPNRGPPNWGVGEKFEMPTKMAAHLLPVLDIDFLCPPTKSLYDSPFALPTGVAPKQVVFGRSLGDADLTMVVP